MDILFLLLSFIFIFGTFLLSYEFKDAVFTNLRLAFIKSSIIVSLLVLVFTELLSFFKILTLNYLSLLWLIVFAFSFMVFITMFKKNNYSLKHLNFNKLSFIKNESLLIKLMLFLVLIVLLSLFYIVFTINTNWDSYTYHLPRVEHWIQNKNVNFYPTNNIRQLYLAPFAEYFILNLRLLAGNALFVNFVQFFSMLNSLLLASLITKFFKLSWKGQLTAVVLALTIPMGVMQSTTTQTDYVVSFFLISFVYFGISITKKRQFSFSDIFFLSVSFSLGLLTKSTFYIFALPFCIFFGIYYIKLFKLKSFYIVFFIISTFLITNFSFLNRNYQQFGSPLGPQKTAAFYQPNLNEEFGIKPMLSNSAKNIGMHLVSPSNACNKILMGAIVKFHEIIDYPLNSTKTNWYAMPYKLNFSLSHDVIGNFFHIILFFISLLIIIFKKSNERQILLYAFLLIFESLLFALLLVWQPWQTRLDLPFFLLATPVIAYALSSIKLKNVNILTCISLLCFIIAILFIYDPIKPIFGKKTIFSKNNSSYVYNYNTAKKIESELEKNNISSVGLILGGDSWEWEYWLVSKNRRFEYVLFNQDLIRTPNFDKDFKYQAIIADNNLWSPSQIDKNISAILHIDKKTTLIIYKEEISTIIIQ